MTVLYLHEFDKEMCHAHGMTSFFKHKKLINQVRGPRFIGICNSIDKCSQAEGARDR